MREKSPPFDPSAYPLFERPPEWWKRHHALVGRSASMRLQWLCRAGLLTDAERALLERRAAGEEVDGLPLDYNADTGEMEPLPPGRAAILLGWYREKVGAR